MEFFFSFFNYSIEVFAGRTKICDGAQFTHPCTVECIVRTTWSALCW